MENALLKSSSSELRSLLYHQYRKIENSSNSKELQKERDQLIKVINSLKEHSRIREVRK